jgi:membrane protease YdiL (CAAX protease family)
MTENPATAPDQPLENTPDIPPHAPAPSDAEVEGAEEADSLEAATTSGGSGPADAIPPGGIPPGVQPEDVYEEWDDTPTAMFLRALFTLLAGGALSWAQWKAPILPGAEYARWVHLAVIANLIVPLGIIWLFFAQGIRPVPWLKNQALNAWNYGWNFGDFKTHAKWSLGLFAIMLPLLIFASRDPQTRAAYSQWFPAYSGVGPFVWSLVLLGVYMFCWEFFHRGFLLFGMAQGWTSIPAIIIQAGAFGLAHWGKPQIEVYGAFAGGLILGIIAWRQKSFAVPFYTHFLIHAAWVLLLLR